MSGQKDQTDNLIGCQMSDWMSDPMSDRTLDRILHLKAKETGVGQMGCFEKP